MQHPTIRGILGTTTTLQRPYDRWGTTRHQKALRLDVLQSSFFEEIIHWLVFDPLGISSNSIMNRGNGAMLYCSFKKSQKCTGSRFFLRSQLHSVFGRRSSRSISTIVKIASLSPTTSCCLFQEFQLLEYNRVQDFCGN